MDLVVGSHVEVEGPTAPGPYYLEAPIARVTGYDVIIPLFSRENAYLPGVNRIVRAASGWIPPPAWTRTCV